MVVSNKDVCFIVMRKYKICWGFVCFFFLNEGPMKHMLPYACYVTEPGLEHLIILELQACAPVDYLVMRQMFTGYVVSEDRLLVRAQTEGAVLRQMWVETGLDGECS